MIQWIVCWSITIVHLVTVSLEDWMRVQRNAVVFTLTVMKTFNVPVTGKVIITDLFNNVATTSPSAVPWLVVYYSKLKHFMTGLLCGRCQHDKGVSVLLNNCKSCGGANLLLIVALGMTELISCIQITHRHNHQFSFTLQWLQTYC